MQGMKQALDMAGGKLWGAVTPQNFAALEDLFLETKLIKQKLASPADYIVGIPNFFEKVGLDYVSASPYRVPVARLAAAQAALLSKAQG